MRKTKKRLLYAIIFLIILIGIIIFALILINNNEPNPKDPINKSSKISNIAKAEKLDLVKTARSVILATLDPKETVYYPNEIISNNIVFVTFRSNGIKKGEGFANDGELIKSAINAAKLAIADNKYGGIKNADDIKDLSIEILILHHPINLGKGNITDSFERGIHSISLEDKGKIYAVASSKAIASNYDNTKMLNYLCSNANLSKNCYEEKEITRYESMHFISSDNFTSTIYLYRGKPYISIKSISLDKINYSIDLMGNWLLNSQQKDGSIKYEYNPSSGTYSSTNNIIRQMMATVALGQLYQYTENEKYYTAYQKNMKYNFDNYYKETGSKDELGYLYMDNEAKLGATAFGILAIETKPKNSDYNEEKKRLIKGLIYLYNETDGSFRTFYEPIERNDNQNFYPGEALLALATLYEETGDKQYLDMIDKSFKYYTAFFRADKNPAFVPWHTMAYYKAYKATGNQKYAKFIFEANDWLLEIQHTGCDPYPDFLGRFYDPAHDEYGPPHASSTGVYLEGLADAYAIAKSKGDKIREEKYKNALIIGIRSIMQLQFTDDNMFYISKKDNAKGGIATSEFNNQIRIDNVQHNLMAFIKISKVLTDEDIRKMYLKDCNNI